ncbi:MAG: hypothetical protein A3F18_06065 [Legionellales bacterium RIFCSPHIGHO2_12_FULL_37_14]|nr:MAG: hypothetical protein A3F18_06065 [Legionellales bacterium RIFCSPHIGHO2_12_FULL_37_14]
MNINIYMEDSLGKYLNQLTKQFGKSRNAIIREAIKEWIENHGIKKWPSSVVKFKGIESVPTFESYRNDVLPPKEDPFA